jgi:hypothetical protein
MSTTFTVEGPLAVPFTRKKGGRVISSNDADKFWHKYKYLANCRGCYVFGVKAGRGSTPGYVGKASKTFRQEIFTEHKRNRYIEHLAEYRKGAPVLFFLKAPSRRGKPNIKHIGELERFLIRLARAANPNLKNERLRQEEDWRIAGMVRSGKGKPRAAARALKRMVKMADTSSLSHRRPSRARGG